MNPHEWKDAIERLQRHLEPNHQSAVNSSVGNTSTSSNNWNTYCNYTTRYAAVEPHGSNVGPMDPSPPPPNVYRKDSKLEELDGEAVKMSEDEELARKKQQLREIEERIIHKKASIALKTVGQLVNKTTADVSCKGETLRERVNVILQQRCPLGFLSKVQSRKDKRNSTNLSKECLPHQQHPLKLRVKAVMKQRSSDDCILLDDREETPEVALPPPSRSLTSPAKEENSVNKGFERFLSILNKGVDINMLSRIVNDDRVDLPLGEELLNIQSSDVEKKSDPVLRSENQQSNSRTKSSETKTDSLTKRLSLPDAEEKNNDKGRRSSSSRSKSPPAAKKKKKKEEEEKPKVDEKQAQLQNILKTLGLSLEVEEMSKLADRTQERLYGKKTVDRQSSDSKGEQESQQRDSDRDSSPSSSSSSSSSSRSSSRSTSRSFSRSPSPRQRHDGRHVSEEARRDREKDGTNSQQISTYQHPYAQNQPFPPPHPAASAFPGYNLYPHYPNNQSVAYSTQTHPPWSQPPIPYPNFSAPVIPVLNTTFRRQREHCVENLISFECPDLAESEGQGESASRPCYLQAVRTVQPSKQPCLKQLVGGSRKKKQPIGGSRKKKNANYKRNRKEKKRLLKQERERQELAQKAEAAQSSKEKLDSKTKQSNEEKPPPTEQEIKANLRKRLEAFNQKAKRSSQLLQSTVMQPANSLTSENG